ncbi:MAG: hypothetical protein AB7F64_07300 [Gammaproteobacteria bacterium]
MPRLIFNKTETSQPDQLLNNLTKTLTDAQTLTQFALGANLSTYEESTLDNYWHSIENLLHYAEELCELFIDHFHPKNLHPLSEVV